MFEQTGLFGVPPGADFPTELLRGLERRLAGVRPEDWARVTLVVNTRRMARRMRAIFDAGPARLLPRVLLLSEIDQLLSGPIPPKPGSGLRRRLDLARMIGVLTKTGSTLGQGVSVFALADSLAALIDEMQGEGVPPERLQALDVSDHSEHFRQTQAFLGIVQGYLQQTRAGPEPEERQRMVVEALTAQWAKSPHGDPIILAGSTASRGTTRVLVEMIAALPMGCVVFPGFDFDMPRAVWAQLGAGGFGALPTEDHAQYRFHAVLEALGLEPDDVQDWSGGAPPSPARNRLVSLALRPAPVTDAWLSEGPGLEGLSEATRNLTLLEAETPRSEALTIAMRLRAALEEGKSAALITPDRVLTRQVSAALDRWNILPDDSAGLPLHLSPPGRFLRHVADLMVRRLDVEALLTLIKHPLCHSGADRNTHLLQVERLEHALRDVVLPFPDPSTLKPIADKLTDRHGAAFSLWFDWLSAAITRQTVPSEATLADWVTRHLALAECFAAGPGGDARELWAMAAGQSAAEAMQDLGDCADASDQIDGQGYTDLLRSVLSGREVRDRDAPDTRIAIWGTLEARVQGADLVILGGLNENTWPEAPAPDPWLNRALRNQAGLLLPDRRIGLSAHDFQQAIGAKEVWLSRSVRSAESETIPSRWLNRLTNLLSGLHDTGGPDVLAAMRARGRDWLGRTRALETPIKAKKALRPHPRPPVDARPRSFSVTDIRTLIRDPYALYARKTLGLMPLGPLRPEPDALMRGTMLHAVLETYVTRDLPLEAQALFALSEEMLTAEVPWPVARIAWLSRMDRVADWFVTSEVERRALATPAAFETRGAIKLRDLGVTIRAKADRIDLDAGGGAVIYDYKTAAPPSDKQQAHFDKQLLIETAMLEDGAFEKIGVRPVTKAQYIGLSNPPKTADAPILAEPPAKVLAELRELMARYLTPEQGYTSRRAPFSETEFGDYDHFARFGEWDATQDPTPEDVG